MSQNTLKNLFVISILIFSALSLGHASVFATGAASVPLGSAGTFGILANTFTNTGATFISGDLSYTTPPLTPASVTGTTHNTNDASHANAGIDQNAAIAFANSQSCTTNLGASTPLSTVQGGVYTPGVYCTTGAADIGSGGITLNGSGNYIFQIGGALTSTSASHVFLINGAQANNVTWVPTQATSLGSNSNFTGNILDPSGITLASTITVTGRLLAFGGSVIASGDTILVPGFVAPVSSVDLGTASNYVILAGSSITNGVAGQRVTGDTGHFTSITSNFAYVGTPLGTDHAGVAVGTTSTPGTPLGDEHAALVTIGTWNGTVNTGMACTFTFAPGAIDLATDTTHGHINQYSSGVYCIDGAASIGTAGINLNSTGTYIFKINGTLNTVANSHITLSGGASAVNVFWAPIGAATLGANTSFKGTILSGPSAITIGDTSNVDQGRLISETAVTIGGGSHILTVPGGITVSTIAITNPPAKTDYTVGTQLNTTGLVVTGTLSNGTLSVAPVVTFGNVHIADSTYSQAGTDQGAALVALNNLSCPNNLGVIVDLSLVHNATYTPGVYCTTGAASIGTGGITLNGSGTYVFRSDGALNTVANSHVTLTNGASASDVFWTPTAATTLGANSKFVGTDIDNSGITIGGNVTWAGRALDFATTVSTGPSVKITAPVPSLVTNLGASGTFAVLSSTFTNTAGGVTLVGDLGYTTGPAVVPTITGFNSSVPVNGQVITVHFGSQNTTYTINVIGTPSVGAAGAFAVLASTYTNTAAAVVITGDLGYTTGPAVVPAVFGRTHIVDSNYSQAGTDQGAALVALNHLSCDYSFTGATDLSLLSQPLTPGVYCTTGAASIGTGGITLNGAGTYVFRSDGALNTVANSHVTLTGGASASDVFWTPTAATTLGANSVFVGTDIDNSGITIGGNVSWVGRALDFATTTSTGPADMITVPGVTISLQTSAGPVSQPLTITGTGFAPNHGITFTFGGNPITPLMPVTSDSSGSFTGIITVPATTPVGAVLVTASDGTNSDSKTFTVQTKSSIVLSKTAGATGSIVTVTGTHFIVGSTVLTTFQGSVVGTTKANSTGAFTSTFAVPSVVPGGYTITSSDGANSDSKTFTVSTSVILVPASGLQGSITKVSGTGFALSHSLTFTFNGTNVTPLVQPKTNTVGTFTALAITVPASLPSGVYTLGVSDGHNSASAQFTVTVPKASLPVLGTAANFAVLGSSTVTNTDNTTILAGNLGVSPGTAITGFPPGFVAGTTYSAGAIAAKAQIDANTAYGTISSAACTTTYPPVTDIGGQTLTPGVYCFPSSAAITGKLTLSGNGVYIFRVASTLVTASSASVVLTNGASASNVFWKVGSSATLGTSTSFEGTIIALASVTATTGATVDGRLIALTGAVTLDTNRISTTPASTITPPTGPSGSTIGTANFAVLGSSTVTNTGSTVITGDVDLNPGTSITGFPPGTILGGAKHTAIDPIAVQARNDSFAAYTSLSNTACTVTEPLIADIGGKILTPGVYCFPSSAAITGKLTLSGNGVYIFKVSSTLVTASSASVVLTNGALASNVFWQVGSSATLGTHTSFEGTIIALASVTATTGATVDGRLVALNGAVTLDSNHVSITTAPLPINPGTGLPGSGPSSTSSTILGYSTVTNTGPSIVLGNVNLSPGTSITGFPPGTISGTRHTGTDPIAVQARTDAVAAYSILSSTACTVTEPTVADIGGQTLTPGVYCFPSSAGITGTLTLSGNGVYIFKVASTLVTASSASVVLTNGASVSNVFWQVGSSATLGTSTSFKGTIIALASITATTGATVDGKLLALTGAVTLDTNRISSVSSSITLVPSSGLPGSTTKVSGVGFASNANIHFTFNGTNVTPVPQPKSTASGTFTSVTIHIPSVQSGTATVTVTDANSTASAIYTVNAASITLSPASGLPGPIVVSGIGFAPSSILHFTINGTDVTPVSHPKSTASGTFTSVSIANPTTFSGPVTVTATDSALSPATASATFTVTVAAAKLPLLGTAANFAVLGSQTVTNTGGTLVVVGNLGVSPGTAITGFPPGTVIGTTYSAGTIAAKAHTDAFATYNTISTICTTNEPTVADIGGQTLTPGVYCFPSSAAITGTLTLSGNGVYIFRIGTTLVTASSASVVLTNGASASNVFWKVGSSATLGTSTNFEGNILALASVTANTGATVEGRLIALTGAVTLDTNHISTTAASLTLTPNMGPLGTIVQVTGAGFSHSSVYHLFYNGTDVTPTSHTTTAAGAIVAKFTVPVSATGNYIITATDSASGSASATFFKLSPSIALSQPSGSPGTAVSIQGFNFAPSHKVTITMDGDALVTVPAATTDSHGLFAVTFIVPNFDAGAVAIAASDGTNHDHAIFTITP